MVEHRLGSRGHLGLAVFSNSEYALSVEAGSWVWGGSSHTERGTTQTRVKVPKCWLSVEIQRVSSSLDSREVGLEAAIL